MKHIYKFSLPLLIILVASCSNKPQVDAAKWQKTELVFPKGVKITNDNFAGPAWVNMLVTDDTTHNVSIGTVTFEPGTRTNWHIHPGGQILLITEGKGYYQEKGKPGRIVHKGDVIKCPPGVAHWHGAAPSDTMTHIAISTNINRGNVIWLEKVTDEEYHRINSEQTQKR